MDYLQEWTKDPDASLDYGIDWSAALAEGVTITASQWSSPSGITRSNAAFTDTATAIRLSGGTALTDYEVANRVTLSTGEIDERTVLIKVRER